MPIPPDSPIAAAFAADYAIERELVGGMSRVFVATERALGRRVVIKVLPPELAAGLNVERFRREIQLAARLQHPHIVPLLAAGETNGLLWFTMPFIEGESLRALIERQGRLAWRDALRLLQDVVEALAYAHAQGIVHRDIKPENILLSGSHAVITDFGVAKALSAAIPLTGHTTTGMAIGTPAYMAPEQLAADPAADHRVDLYAVGLVAYEMLTGTSPFRADSPQATLAAQLTVRPAPISRTIPDVPEAFSALVLRCLEKEASARPADAPTLLAALDGVRAAPPPTAAAPPRARLVLAAVGAVLLAAAAYALGRERAPAPPPSPRIVVGDSTAGAVPETVVVYRDAAGGDTALGGQPLPVVLSRAESLAVARGRTDGAPDTDSLIAAISRVFADSMERALARLESTYTDLPRQRELQALVTGVASASAAAAATASGLRAAPAGGAPSLVPPGAVAPGTPPPATTGGDPDATRDERAARDARSRQSRVAPPEMALIRLAPRIAPPPAGVQRVAVTGVEEDDRRSGRLARAIADSLRAVVLARGGGTELADPDVTERVRQLMGAGRIAIGFSLRADVVVDGRLLVDRDSVALVTLVTDVRAGVGTRAFRVAAPRDSATALGALLAPTRTWLGARLDSLAAAKRAAPDRGGRR